MIGDSQTRRAQIVHGPAAGVLFRHRSRLPPESAQISPALIEAARRDGAVAFYTAMEIPVAESLQDI